MRKNARVAVVIPALNEADSIARVLDDIPAWVDEVIVADNGSDDNTACIASDHAHVVVETRKGYGSACLAGIAAVSPSCDIVVFLDGDYSDFPEQMDRLVDPIANNETDMVIGSRVLGHCEPGALTPPQRFGNALACRLIRLFWGMRYTDLGPFRAIRAASLRQLGMQDPDYGWTVEMQIKAVLAGLRVTEVPVDYRNRVGKSKISGTVRGVIGAGYKILSTIFLAALKHRFGARVPRRRLIIFTRFPEPGRTKTRLIPALGPEGAATLQKQLTEHALNTADNLPDVDIEVRYTGAERDDIVDWLGDSRACVDQGGGDLGDRMRSALQSAFDDGCDQAVVIGIDCPDITQEILNQAFDRLAQNDLVLGPAIDGGYYLIGARSSARDNVLRELFEDMAWGTDSVYADTVRRAHNANIDLATLVPLCDIDHPEDIRIWDCVVDPNQRPPLSVVIPTLNEESTIVEALSRLGNGANREIIVIDGNSTDDTVARAQKTGATVIQSRRGRARQMNAGAARATGEIILFLHADTELPNDFEAEINAVLNDPDTVLGAFRFATDAHGFAMHWMTFWANVRARVLGTPYGDQALFLRREQFRSLGGYPPVPIMEDFLLVRRAARSGKVRIARSAAITSARRWRRVGPWKSMVYNQLIVLGYVFGVHPEKLARFYRGTL